MMRAVFLMFVAMSLIPVGDTAGKLLSESGVSPVFVTWSRFVFGGLLVLLWFWRGAVPLLADWRIWFRAALTACGITCIQFALRAAPIGDVFAAFFIGPIFSYVLAGILLREPTSRLRSVMIVLGFVGVLLVVRPGADMSIGLLFAVLAGLFYGAFLTASRWLAHVGEPGPMVLTQLGISALLLTPFGIPHIPEMTGTVWTFTLISAFCSMAGNLLLIYAYRLAPATSLAPLVYFQMLGAVLLGWLVFQDVPDALTWIGIAIILISGVIAARAR